MSERAVPTRPRRPLLSADFLASRGNDAAVVLCATAIIALLILPVPAPILDVLISFNILIGVTLTLTAIYIAAPTDFTAFPSILLISTLYRLSLSIATTRTILTTAHAGHIIDVFGNITAGGNLVVGLVIFLIITIVQFIVIAKGAERVGEVAARFSLDAMPGKQMSIDSDLRSGVTDRDETRRRRRLLELESKLHGSLDGAMKFVKGDAIAGIVIVAINLLGGLTIGVLQQHLSFGDAIQTYSVLTIGDGMVTQIPALLSAMSAGLIVTRISGDGQEGHLGEAIQQQLMQKPRVQMLGGCLCLGLACVPGFPSLVFIGLGASCIALGVWMDPGLRRRLGARAGRLAPLLRLPDDTASNSADAGAKPQGVRPLVLELSGVADPETRRRIAEALAPVTDGFAGAIGLPLPRIRVVDAAAVGDDSPRWRLLAFDAWIAGGERAAAADDDLADEVRQALRRNLGLFVGVQETAALIHAASASYPEATKEVNRVLSVMRLAEIVRVLVEEEVPIRNLHLVLEALADVGQREKDGPALAAAARVAISRQIVGQYAVDGKLKALALAQPLEAQLRGALNNSGAVPQIALDPADARGLIQALRNAVQAFGAQVLVAPPDLRRPVRKLIAADLFDVPVLAYSELKPPLKLEIAGRVALTATQAVAA